MAASRVIPPGRGGIEGGEADFEGGVARAALETRSRSDRFKQVPGTADTWVMVALIRNERSRWLGVVAVLAVASALVVASPARAAGHPPP